MERKCPVCGHRMERLDIVCVACRGRIEQREPVRRECVLYAWGRGIMICIALLLFVKSVFALFGPREYEAFMHSLGLRLPDPEVWYLNIAFAASASVLYAVAWIGGYLKLRWEGLVCALGLLVFVVGQAITQLSDADAEGGLARALALFVVWIAIPVCQFATLTLGRRRDAPPCQAEAPATPAGE